MGGTSMQAGRWQQWSRSRACSTDVAAAFALLFAQQPILQLRHTAEK